MPNPKLPETIGRYRILEAVGVGAMGRVYRAEDPMLHRIVAVKTLRTEHLDEEARLQFLARFRIEAQAVARLTHPNIVQVFDFGDNEEHGPYIVMEYVPGESLRKLIRSGHKFSHDEILTIVNDVSSALDEAHSKQVLHRDIKPDNVIIMPDGHAKLADFGVARVPDADLTKEGQFVGTPWYAAPETIRESRYSPQSDGYGLAATVYEMLTGRRAFAATETPQLVYQVLNQTPIPPSRANPKASISRSVDSVILKGLNKAPDKRFQSTANFAAALKLAFWKKSVPSARRTFATITAFTAIIAGVVWLMVPLFGQTSNSSHARSTLNTVPSSEKKSAPQPTPAQPADNDSVEDEFDAYYPRFNEMSSHDREEAAKDELDAARYAMNRQIYAEAMAALRRAERLDPSNEDAVQLREDLKKRLNQAP